jgi:AcrR family transcriptional regulator
MKQERLLKNHETIRQEIKETAWNQISESGAPALSLRSIARSMGLTTPALYRYFASRDDLVNALISDAYASFASALEAARDGCPSEDHRARLCALCYAYHSWALEYPQRYILIFATPVPGYKLAGEAGLAADHSFRILLEVIQDAARAGKIRPMPGTPALLEQFDTLRKRGEPYTPQVIHTGLRAWSMLHGLVSLELYGQFTPMLGKHVEDLISAEVDHIVRSILA